MVRTALAWMALAWMALTACVWANGGGYRYGINFTGGVAPFEPSGTEHIQILDEKLSIELGSSEAQVEVRYRMKNLAHENVKVRFGFPVEVTQDPFGGIEDASKVSEAERESRSRAQCKDYQVFANGQVVKEEFQPEPFATGSVKPFPGSEVLTGIHGWHVSQLTFKADQESEVVIRYRSCYENSNSWVSEDADQSPLKFRYRLSTGGVWAGPIAHGQVRVSCKGIDASEVMIKMPAGRFKREKEDWVWVFDGLEPTLADDLTIEAVPGYAMAGRSTGDGKYTHYLERRGVWSRVHGDYSVKASSTLPPAGDLKYDASNVNDDERENAWSEGVAGDGIGEWLEITPKKAAALSALLMTPGYAKGVGSDSLYQVNNRPSKVAIELNGEYRIEREIPDKAESWLISFHGYSKPVAKIKVTILGVHKGSRYQDTCIHSIELAERLSKKPKLEGVR